MQRLRPDASRNHPAEPGTEQVLKHEALPSSQGAAARLRLCPSAWVWVAHQAEQDPFILSPHGAGGVGEGDWSNYSSGNLFEGTNLALVFSGGHSFLTTPRAPRPISLLSQGTMVTLGCGVCGPPI